jgi:lauroyl/myristoyl acyltransferase
MLLARLASRRLASGRWSARLEGAPPSGDPTVYVSAHLGSLQGLRYTLRARGVRVATVLGPHNLERTEAQRQDRVFDARHPLDFPHVFEASRVHRLRTALGAGSLVFAADLPAEAGIEYPFLGGVVHLDPRPFRLARATGVACRPAFLTMPRGRFTLTLGDPLPADERAALEAYAGCLSRVAERSPLDLDGVVYLNLARARDRADAGG